MVSVIGYQSVEKENGEEFLNASIARRYRASKNSGNR